MTIGRRDFLRRAAAVVAAPWAASACGRGDTVPGDVGVGDFGAAGVARTGDGGPTASIPELVRVSWPRYDDVMVVDALAGPIQFNIPQESLPLSPTALEAVRASGITAVNLTVNGRGDDSAAAFEATLARIDAWDAEVAAHPDVLLVGRSVADLGSGKESRRLALVYGLQDGVPFEGDLDRLEVLHSRGVRIIQPTYNVQNLLGSGCLVPDEGMTALGRDAVARMESLGILLDLSHCGPRTTRDGIESATGPVSITHSGCKAIFDHPRSKDDDTMRALAERGGVFGVYLMPFLNPEGPPTAADVVAHIEHALDVCGEDHVGIGSDQGIVPLNVEGDFQERFDAVSRQRAAAGIAAPREDTVPYVPQLNDPRRLETIAGLLSDRGHPDRVVEKVVGANFVRLFEEVWA